MVDKVVILKVSDASPWTVPADFSSVNTIHVIGAGGGGCHSTSSGEHFAGGGGAWETKANLTLSGTVAFTIGVVGTNSATVPTAGGDTWFNGASLAASSCGAKGGGAATTTAHGSGGASASGIGDSGNSGGNGGDSGTSGAGGGAGAGGPNGVGKNGGNGGSSGSGGGGAANNGSNGANAVTSTGGAGGNGRGGSGGGTVSGGAGTAGTGSGGGGCSGGSAVVGGTGAQDTIWTDNSGGANNGLTAGPGGGGGGGAGATSNSRNGGPGGGYGASGGSAGSNSTVCGAPSGGLIVIIYTPATGIAFDAATDSTYQAAASSYSWSHTCTGSNRYLTVGVAMLSLAQTVTSITYSGIALQLLGIKASISGACRIELWGLVAPSTGSNTIAVTLSGAIASAGCASSYTGVHQGSPVEAFNSAQATNVGAADATVAITTVADNDMVVDIVATDDTAITVGAGQTQAANVTGAGGSGAMSYEGPKTPAGAVTMSWANVGALATWAIGGIALRPIAASSLKIPDFMGFF